ncbi:hypothetical protein EV580_6560 [Mycobacterium sp. BK086]|uniref:hypothetical protein n=1 Tax=Mycobacterium sp. BK086 TaxID=2512165 RepID=UPI00105B7D20|nr:hypothetical protein [Mycobacterium sp. BK086]TDO06469.1 hypothetical protein EV580_6560 [Mycobacterium sp. BK086]
MTDRFSGLPTRAEAVFAMEPAATLLNLVDLLVKSHTAYARVATQTHKVHAEGLTLSDPTGRVAAAAERFHHQYLEEALPSLIASLQLTAEVVRSFGLGPCRVDDPVEAAIWNNKWFVYVDQLRPRLPAPPPTEDRGTGGR